MITVKHSGVSHKVPCGKCAFCLTNRRSQWMFRIHHEMKNQEHRGYFLTLTYDEKHVRRVGGRLSLRFRDVQLFLKRVRKDKYYCKYVCVGEYGGVTKRPHYHMLLWTDCPDHKFTVYWQQGNVHVGKITMESAMYTLKYIIQPKQTIDHVQDPKFQIEKTRAQFSKGLGISYLTSSVYDFHTRDYENPVFHSYIDGNKVALPRYYRNKIFTKYQMSILRDELLEETMTKRAAAVRKALAQGAGVIKERVTLLERFKAAKLYLKNLRIDHARNILNKTKFNETF